MKHLSRRVPASTLPIRRHAVLAFRLATGVAVCTAVAAHAADLPDRAVVFFTADSAALDDNARSVVREAADLVRTRHSASVRVLGFAAPDTGTPEFNHELARARAQSVADNLVADGVPKERVHIEARGPVPFEDIPTESRRVEIAIGN